MARDRTRTGGRKAGTPNRVTLTIRARIESLADPIAFMAAVQNGDAVTIDGKEVHPTLDQRLSAAAFLGRKLIADAKDQRIRFDLPPLEHPEDVLKASRALLTALAVGDMSPNEAQAVSAMLETHRKLFELTDLEKRIAALEGRTS